METRKPLSVCHHHSELLPDCGHTRTVHTHTIPPIIQSVTSEIWQRQAGQGVSVLTSSSWEWTRASVSVCNAPMVTQGSLVLVHFLFLWGTPSAQRTWQLTLARLAVLHQQENKKIQHLNGNQLHLLLIELQLHPFTPSSLSFSSTTSTSFTQLWVIKLNGRGGLWLGDWGGG